MRFSKVLNRLHCSICIDEFLVPVVKNFFFHFLQVPVKSETILFQSKSSQVNDVTSHKYVKWEIDNERKLHCSEEAER